MRKTVPCIIINQTTDKLPGKNVFKKTAFHWTIWWQVQHGISASFCLPLVAFKSIVKARKASTGSRTSKDLPTTVEGAIEVLTQKNGFVVDLDVVMAETLSAGEDYDETDKVIRSLYLKERFCIPVRYIL